MPSWSSFTPSRFPGWLARFGSFPKCKIFFVSFFIFLVCLCFLSFSFLHPFQLAILKLFFIFLNVKIDRTIRFISIPVINNSLNKLYDFIKHRNSFIKLIIIVVKRSQPKLNLKGTLTLTKLRNIYFSYISLEKIFLSFGLLYLKLQLHKNFKKFF